MVTIALSRIRSGHVVSRSHAVVLLQVLATTVFVFPSDVVMKAIGGAGYPAAVVSYLLFAAWVVASLFGRHDPLRYRSPVRTALCVLWLASLATYIFKDRALLTVTQQAAEDRWVMQLAGVSGIVLVASECLRSIKDIKRVLRAVTWGGAFCGLVAGLQFRGHLDLTPYLRLPGFSLNAAAAGYSAISSRGDLARVTGTAIHPIELGVTAAMLLPLAIWMGMYDTEQPKLRRWLPVLFIGIAIPASVSRSAIIGVVVSIGCLIALLPPIRRLQALAFVPVAIAGVFVSAHGLIGTLTAYFAAGTSDPSIANRTNNYPMVERLVEAAPLLGRGGGTYIAASAINILDNEYLTVAIELGLVGVAALAFFLLWPAFAAFSEYKRTTNREMKDLCAALFGAELAATLCSATFDSLSFPMFVNVQAIVLGLIGAIWFLVKADARGGVPFPSLAGGYPGEVTLGESGEPRMTRRGVEGLWT